jgi:hypothetical protein
LLLLSRFFEKAAPKTFLNASQLFQKIGESGTKNDFFCLFKK